LCQQENKQGPPAARDLEVVRFDTSFRTDCGPIARLRLPAKQAAEQWKLPQFDHKELPRSVKTGQSRSVVLRCKKQAAMPVFLIALTAGQELHIRTMWGLIARVSRRPGGISWL
jgi:hypothetical protein